MRDDPNHLYDREGHEGRAEDGVDRRGFLQCMAWAGTGLVWVAAGGILSSRTLSQAAPADAPAASFTFVQISDTHIGFKGEANKDALGTFEQALAGIKALEPAPAFIIHTGDLTHAQKAGAFDTVTEALKGTRAERVFYVPGENDVFADGGKEYLSRFGGPAGNGWQSFDYKGVHFIGLVNVLNFKAGGLGSLGPAQLEWLTKDVERLSSNTPIVVFAHVPLWAVYPKWGWVTDDGEQALSSLKRFGSVTVLNGHIHQSLQKVEGNIRFHTALSTAFPQPAPGVGEGPGPLKVQAEELRKVLGLREVTYIPGKGSLAVVDSTLAEKAAAD
ncbi:MAG: metallophosphoesterase [Candidatus Rokuibacteriota bacterium]|nr:MAG: metallophosphoesterase [Candidatus Rokubacteria bacterium]